MIGKAKSCKGGTALANYVMQDVKGYELFRNGVSGETPTEILQEMKIIQNLNQRATNRTLSLVISPEPSECERLTDRELANITKEFLKDLKIDPDKQQFIAFVHNEKSHKHIHIIANRVRTDGRLLPDHCIGKKAQWAAHRVAKKYDLISAKEKMIKNLKNKENLNQKNKAIRKQIKKKHDWVMSKKPESVQVYIQLMAKLGIEVTPTINKAGNVQGMRVNDLTSGKDFKGSEVHRSMSLIKIMKTDIPYETSYDDMYVDQTVGQEPILREIAANGIQEVFSTGLEILMNSQSPGQQGVEEDPQQKKKRKKKSKNYYSR